MYCTACGAVLDSAGLVCPACGQVVYRQLKVGAGVLITGPAGLLLVQRSPDADSFPGTWSLPAGYCLADEDPRLTAAREALEETSMAIEVERLVDTYYFDDDPRGPGLLVVYDGRVIGGRPQADGVENVAIQYFPVDRLPEHLCGGGHDRAIRAWEAQRHDRWQPGLAPRFCPHCTHALEEKLVFGRQRLACPVCGFVHLRELKVGVSVLIEREERLLLVRRAIEPGLGQWSLPSGFVDWDEAPEMAAARESVEETGLEVRDLRLVDAVYYTDDFRGPGVNLVYAGTVVGGALQAGDDAAIARFFAPEELPPAEKIAFANHRLLVARWQQGAREQESDRAAGRGLPK